MHELSIAYSIVELAGERAQAANARKVNTVHLRLGALSGVVKDALLFGWDVATENTLLANAHLQIEDLPVIVVCPQCRAEVVLPGSYPLYCPHCGATDTYMIQGNELELQSIEIEE
jgi:hydrogenase nickel incorporation protein HypA/HybF